MTTRYLEYQPVNGYVHNWLVAGPHIQAEAGPFAFEGPLALEAEAVDRQKVTLNGADLTWKYTRCLDDHLVDVSLFAETPQTALAVATAQLLPDQPGPARLTLTSFGPAELWLNGQRIAETSAAGSSFLQPHSISVAVELGAENTLALRFAQSGVRALALACALQVSELSGGLKVRVGTQVRFPRRHYLFEQAFDLAHLENLTHYRGAHFNLHFSQGIGSELTYAYSVQDQGGMIYVEGSGLVDPEVVNDVGHTFRLYERPYWVTLRAPGKEYWEQDLRYEMRLPIYVLDNDYSVGAGGDFTLRRSEALTAAAKRDGLVFAELARMGQDQWQNVSDQTLFDALVRVARQAVDSSLDLVGLVSIAVRYSQNDKLSDGLVVAIAGGLLNYPYRQAAAAAGQSERFLLLTAELLAGQWMADNTFSDGRSGQEHCQLAGQDIMDAMRAAGQHGFMEWDSPVAFERFTVALAHLVGLPEDDELRDMAAVLLDKVLFLLAVNSYRGGLSGTHGCTRAAMLRSTQLQATAGITRLMWGSGVCNQHIAGPISLALADYEFPTFFSQIAADPNEMLSRERHAGGGQEVNKVVYRTADYLLASAQDYRPGQPGQSELIWQATLGPNTQVFSSAPANFGSDEAHQPGFWLGNVALPRVAQWKDALLAVYHLPADSWLDFTHAYFPIYEFDEYAFEGGWAFGRKGDGFVALAAASGFELVGRVPDGQRELRAPGRTNTWICQMGRVATDGSFVQFKQAVQALALTWGEDGARFTSLRGEELAFGWQGALTVNGQEQPLAGFAHIDNPFCRADLPAERMDITYGEIVMQLDFE